MKWISGFSKPILKTNSQNRFSKPILKTNSQNWFSKPILKTNSQNRFSKPILKTNSQNQLSKLILKTDSQNRFLKRWPLLRRSCWPYPCRCARPSWPQTRPEIKSSWDLIFLEPLKFASAFKVTDYCFLTDLFYRLLQVISISWWVLYKCIERVFIWKFFHEIVLDCFCFFKVSFLV